MLELALRHLSELRSLRQASRVYRFILLLPVLALLNLHMPPAQAQGGCVTYFSTDGVTIYLLFPSSNILTSSTFGYIDPGCTVSGRDAISSDPGPWSVGDGFVLASNSTNARELCRFLHGDRVLGVALATTYTRIYRCHARSNPEGPRSAGGAGGAGSSRGCGTGIDLPLTGLRLHAYDGMDSGIQFRRLDHCGVGIESVIDMGFLDAVDIWSDVGSGYDVCFPQIGRIVFLDAATSPRSVVFPEYRFDDGWTCASMGRAGTMVLVEAPASTVALTSTTTRRPGTNDSIDDAIPLGDCAVTPRVNLRLRVGPWGTILDVVPRDTEVAAKARTKSWFNVTYLEQDGWSAAWLADSEGECERSSAEAGDG